MRIRKALVVAAGLQLARRVIRRLVLVGIAVVAILAVSYFIVSLRDRGQAATPCEAIPDGTVLFSLAFLNLGEKDGKILPGRVNELLARRMEECSNRLAIVLTQKAVSDALATPTELENGTPVEQMHLHRSDVNVRTVGALRCALGRLDPEPAQIAVLAQSEQLSRASVGLRAMYRGKIVKVYPGAVFDNDDGWGSFVRWHAKNAGGWLEAALAHLGGVSECPAGVRLPKIKWRQRP